MREWLMRLRDWLRRDRLDGELADELRFHREHLERDARAAGADDAAAAWAARRRLGNETRYREESRDHWSWPWLDHLLQDLRYAFRGMRRAPGFTATVVLTLALGIGANASMFGLLDRLLLRPFPYLAQQGRTHRVYLSVTRRGEERIRSAYEYARFLDLAAATTSFDLVSGYSAGPMAVGSGDAAREHRVARVSASFWDFFDAPPALGRYFLATEDTTPVGAPVVVLSHAYWLAEFAGRRDILGDTLTVGDIRATVIGVAPRGFVGIAEGLAPVAYIPITTFAGSRATRDASSYFTTYQWGWMSMIARRKPGVSAEAASRDVAAAHWRSWHRELEQSPDLTPAEVARPGGMVGPLRMAAGPTAGLETRTLLWVAGVAVIVLIIACANVANLILARMLRRRREIAVRLALGVSRGRLVAQSLTESLALAGLGCLAGVLVAQFGGAALRRLFVQQERLDVLADTRTLAVAVAAALVAGVLTGIVPALAATRAGLAASLKVDKRDGSGGRSRTRSALLVIQGALSVLLLVGAGLFVRSLGHARNMRLGFDTEPLLLVNHTLRGLRLDSAEAAQLALRLEEAARAIPGVANASLASSVPFWSTSTTNLHVPGIDSVQRLGEFTYQSATGDYFSTIGTRIVAGRALTADDLATTLRVVVVSQSMARVLWPGRDPIGQCLHVGGASEPCSTVVGIAEDARQRSLLNDDTQLRYYVPMTQLRGPRGAWLIVRMRGAAAGTEEVVRRALQQVMPGESYVLVRPFAELIDGQQRSWRVGATLFAAFGVLALLVAAVGLYGVIAYGVAQRMHELGVRVALGAQRAHLLRLVVGQSLRLALTGTVAGVLVALLLSRWVQPLLFQQSARDPAVYLAVGGTMVVVALLASAAPATRAAGADPSQAFRAD